MQTILIQFDERLAKLVHLLPSGLTPAMNAISFLGLPIVVILGSVIIATIAWFKDARRIALASVAGLVGMGGNTVLKHIFHRVRPHTIYTAHMKIQSYSFPSGHAHGSTVFYGLLAYLAFTHLPKPWNLVIPVLLALLILLIGISRVFLGAHFPTDVIAGWLLGSLTLCLIVKFIRPNA